MSKKRATLFSILLALLLHILSIILIPVLIVFSALLRIKIDQAYETYGLDDTVKLIAYFPLFGHIKVIFGTKKRKLE
ncbi:MAG: hypothetical protein HWN66_01235 [Candidatus Helarchaeota archaeon]|nr:hypothetical protein [Candidatus Helarchaeota archaeon]